MRRSELRRRCVDRSYDGGASFIGSAELRRQRCVVYRSSTEVRRRSSCGVYRRQRCVDDGGAAIVVDRGAAIIVDRGASLIRFVY